MLGLTTPLYTVNIWKFPLFLYISRDLKIRVWCINSNSINSWYKLDNKVLISIKKLILLQFYLFYHILKYLIHMKNI